MIKLLLMHESRVMCQDLCLVIKAGELKQTNTQRNFRLKVKVPITTFNEAELRSK